MSGTSLDGVDAVLVDLRGRPFLLGAAFLRYPKSLKAILLALHEISGDEVHRAALAGLNSRDSTRRRSSAYWKNT